MAIVGYEGLRARTHKFALEIVKLSEELPRSRSAEVISRQLLRSGTSVAANYRAASRARSTADFVSKMGVVEEEADESEFWLELLSDSGLASAERLAELLREANELIAIVVASRKTATRR